MNIFGWTLLWINLLGYALAFRRISGQLAWHMNANPAYSWDRGKPAPTLEQWSGAIFFAALLSCAWPLSLPIAYGIAASRTQRGILSGLLYTPSNVRERIMKERIEELEREVGVR